MVPDEEDGVERFIGGLPDNIQGNVIATNPTRLQDAIRIANQLMDKKLQGWDLSYMANEEENHALVADDEAPTEFALITKSSSSSENLTPPNLYIAAEYNIGVLLHNTSSRVAV
nr:reverse transcriptase domain-containing protein [Tanacetum cinerariifolium]